MPHELVPHPYDWASERMRQLLTGAVPFTELSLAVALDVVS